MSVRSPGHNSPAITKSPDIAGISSGMTVASVKKVAKENGYVPTKIKGKEASSRPVKMGPSFQHLVLEAKGKDISKIKLDAVRMLRYSNLATQEQLNVTFTPFEGGPFVTGIRYVTHAENVDEQLLLERAIKKFGQPKYNDEAKTYIWMLEDVEGRAVEIRLSDLGFELKVSNANAEIKKLVRENVTSSIREKPAATTF